ncbi:hypothetical protein [Escherichia coli]|uniref:hypothetical protein n=1 Tax=Escherichia coli TaxID=562 RepID=UPI001C7060F6|nr:hypothetical protein [Escherichia coli]MBW9566958.1 hypothetical protein [Escherichia coli]
MSKPKYPFEKRLEVVNHYFTTDDATLTRLIWPTRCDFVGRISKAHPAFNA